MDHPARHWTGVEPGLHRADYAANTTTSGGPAQLPARTSNAPLKTAERLIENPLIFGVLPTNNFRRGATQPPADGSTFNHDALPAKTGPTQFLAARKTTLPGQEV